MKMSVLIAAGLMAATAATAALAHSGATGIVKERMDGMSAMGDVVKNIAAMMRGDKPYDAAAVRDGATVIASHSGEAMTRLFPEDSGGKPSEARPEIWSDWDTFSNLADRLAVLAEALEGAAENGLMMSGGGRSAGQGMMGAGSTMMDTGSGVMGSGSGMMGSGMMGTGPGMMGPGGALPDPAALAAMPADGVFNMVTQTCSACHTKFRLEKK